MQIIAVTDIHGAYHVVEQILKIETPDILVLGGDLTTVGSVGEAEAAVQGFMNLCGRVLSIAGNMDLPQHDELFHRMKTSVNGRGVVVEGVGIFGVSAAPHSVLRTPYEIKEEKIIEIILSGYAQVKYANKKILISHAPPYGTKVDIIHAGIHVGSTAVREFIESYQPDLTICGHIHEGRGRDKIDKSEILNCGSAAQGNYALVEILNDKIEASLKHHKIK